MKQFLILKKTLKNLIKKNKNNKKLVLVRLKDLLGVSLMMKHLRVEVIQKKKIMNHNHWTIMK